MVAGTPNSNDAVQTTDRANHLVGIDQGQFSKVYSHQLIHFICFNKFVIFVNLTSQLAAPTPRKPPSTSRSICSGGMRFAEVLSTVPEEMQRFSGHLIQVEAWQFSPIITCQRPRIPGVTLEF